MTVSIFAAPGVTIEKIDTSVVVPPPPGIAIGDTIAITVLSGIRTTPGTSAAQQPGGNEPLGSRAVVTAISPITDGMLWYAGTWSGSGRTGYVRDARVVEVAVTGPPAPTITNLRATPPSLPASGGPVSIDATVTDAQTVQLDGVGVTLPTPPIVLTSSHTFLLTADGATLPQARAQVTVIVAPVVQPGSGVLADLPPGFGRDIGDYANKASTWGSKEWNRVEYSGLAYDAIRKLIRFFGGGHGPGQMTDIRSFDPATGKWSSVYPSIDWTATTEANLDRGMGKWLSVGAPTARHTYNLSVVVGDRFYLLTASGMVDNTVDSVGALGPWGGRLCWYDFGTGIWTFSARSGTSWGFNSAAALDPISEKVLVIGPSQNSGAAKMWLYDPATDAVPIVLQNIPTTAGSPILPIHGGAIDLVYFPPNDRFYSIPKAGAARVVFEVLLNRATPTQSTITPITTAGTPPPNASVEPMGFAYDSVNNIIGGYVVNGVFHALDPVARTWTAKAMLYEGAAPASLPKQTFHCLEFDPVSGCFIFLERGARQTTWGYRYG